MERKRFLPQEARKAEELMPWLLVPGISCGIWCAWPWGGLKSGNRIHMGFCGADWAEEKPEGKKMLLRRGGGTEHPLLWVSNRRLMGKKLCTHTGLWGKTGIILINIKPGIYSYILFSYSCILFWKAPREWKHSSTYFFRAHVLYLPCFLETFLQNSIFFISLFAVGMAKLLLLIHFLLIFRELKTKNW